MVKIGTYIRGINWVYSSLFRILFSRSFWYFGRSVKIRFPDAIEGAKHISIGSNTLIGHHVFLAAHPLSTSLRAPLLQIGSNCFLGRSNHVYACESIILGDDVLTGSGVYISDNTHSFEDHTQPIHKQDVISTGPISIGDGTWLANNVCIIGASVGKNCVVGSNAVVLDDIPDFCVAVGSPARIVKRYDSKLKKWRSVNTAGEYT